MDKRSILIIEDESQIAEMMSLHLNDHGFLTTWVDNGLDGLTLALKEKWQLIILDINLPKLNGFEVCEQIRGVSPITPIILISARNGELDRVSGLNLGADDYISKPFGINEFIARVNAVLRRSSLSNDVGTSEVLSIKGIALDESRHKALVQGRTITLTKREFDLLKTFVKSPGKVFSRAELLESVWGYCHEGYMHTVNSHINRLRSKIEPDPANPIYIQTIWGVGYKLEAE